MGRRGPLPRVRDRQGEPLEASAALAVVERRQSAARAGRLVPDVPVAPAGLLPESRAAWQDFWTSGAATWVDRGAHMQRLVRWIRDVDAWHRIARDMKPTKPGRGEPPPAPEDLAEGARRVWVEVLEATPALAAADRVLLRAYCEAEARYRHASALLEASGPLVRSRGGRADLIRNPIHQVVVDNARLSASLARDLGLAGGGSGGGPEVLPGVFDSTRPWLARGSAGQIARHPMADELDRLDARIHRAEVEFGMTPYASVRLGLAGVQGALTAEQLRRLIDERAGESEDVTAQPWADGFVASR